MVLGLYSFSLDETKLAISRFESSAQSDPRSEVVPTGPSPVASVTQWDLSSSKAIAESRTVTLPESNGPLKNIEFLKDNQTLSIFDEQATLQRYDLSKPQPKIREFKLGEPKVPLENGRLHKGRPVGRHDGRKSKGKARLWNAWADDPLAKPIDLNGFNSEIDQWVHVVPGRWLIARSTEEPAMRLWNLQASRVAAPLLILRGSRLAENRDRINTFVVTQNDRWLITGSTSAAPRHV